MNGHSEQARRIAAECAQRLAGTSRAVALTGSVAAGTDHADSDIDLIALADRPGPIDIRSIKGRMVTVGHTTAEQIRASFTHPPQAGVAVAAWREARPLVDPDGLLAEIKRDAEAWRWDSIAPEADRWAASGLVGLAEEAHKTAGMLTTGRLRAACANRMILALQLPGLLAAAHRLLYRTENDLWGLVCDAEGPAWAEAWDAAAGTSAVDAAGGCRAALTLYRIAAERLRPACTTEEAAVVDTACRLAADTS